MSTPIRLDRRHLIAATLALPLVAHAQGKGAQPVELRGSPASLKSTIRLL